MKQSCMHNGWSLSLAQEQEQENDGLLAASMGPPTTLSLQMDWLENGPSLSENPIKYSAKQLLITTFAICSLT